jgi:hypothetical protein
VEDGYDIAMTEKKAVCHRSRTESINRRCLANVWFSDFHRPSQHLNLDRHCTPTQRQRGHRNGVGLLQCVGQGAELLPVHWNPSLTYVPFRQDCVLIAPIQQPFLPHTTCEGNLEPSLCSKRFSKWYLLEQSPINFQGQYRRCLLAELPHVWRAGELDLQLASTNLSDEH